ncbi:hypothetical protein AAHE18_05G071500 [Arachis hypogaea]
MGFHFSAKQAISKSTENKKNFVIPISYLNQHLFQELLSEVEKEFGHDHPIGGLIIPCSEHVFHQLTSPLS